jgi:hypothetical protein
MSGMDNALSAASLLLAAVALIYGAWSGDIEREVTRDVSPNANAKEKEKAHTRAVLWGKAIPLAIAGWAIVAVFTPRTMLITFDTCRALVAGTWRYGDVTTIFVLSTALSLALAIHLVSRVLALCKALRK